MLSNHQLRERYYNKFSWKEISDPIYDYVYFNREIEEKIINSIIIQRLRYIMQLQTAHLVYPGAVHTRFQHSVGVMHLAGEMAEDLLSKILEFYGEETLGGYRLDTLIQAVRLAGLLHDAGHACFGHAFEEALLWTNKNIPEKVSNHERIGLQLVELLLEDKIKEFEDAYGLDQLYDVLLQILGPDEPKEPIIQMIRWLVKDSLYPSDILDFLRRDSYYTGTNEYGYIAYERLFRNTYPYFDDRRPLLLLDRNTWGEFRAYLYAKANMFEHVYFHSVNRAFDRLLKNMLHGLDEEVGLTEAVVSLAEGDPTKYLGLVDVKMYSVMLEKAMNNNHPLSRLARKLLIDRKPEWKRVGREYILSSNKGPEAVKWIVKLLFDKKFREELKTRLEEELYTALRTKGISRDDIWLDIVTISPVPQSVLISEKTGQAANLLVLFMGKKKGKRIAKDRELYLIEEGIPLQVIFRPYIRRGLHRLEYEKIATAVISDTIRDELEISEDEYRKVLKEVYEELPIHEAGRQKITV